jgi:hypothetical protein
MSAPTVYWIDDSDRITRVSPEWDAFALSNEGRRAASVRILGDSIWRHIANPTVHQLYEHMVRKARRGSTIVFPFRCDSPDTRRLFEMTIQSPDGREVQFRSELRMAEQRAPLALLDAGAPRSTERLLICGWCHRLALPGGKWIDLDEAVSREELLSSPRLPMLSHGICEHCEKELLRQLELAQ